MQDGVLTTVVTVHDGVLVVDVVDMDILHDGVNVTVCVNVSITVDTTGCGLSTGIISSTIFETSNIYPLQVCIRILLADERYCLLPATVSHMSLTLLFPQILVPYCYY